MIFLTTDVNLFEKIDRHGIQAYLKKPLTSSKLLDIFMSLQNLSPQKSQQTAKVPDLPATKGSFSAFRILLVDDNPVNQQVSKAMLDYFGCQTDIADNGDAALLILSEKPYDLILMDCQMPVMDGYEATRAIRAREAALHGTETGRRIPVVALTAHAMKGDREMCLEAGMDDYLAKPFRPEELHAVLARWLSPGTTGGEETGHGGRDGMKIHVIPAPEQRNDTAAPPQSDVDHPSIDIKALDVIRALDSSGSGNLLEKVIQMFIETSPSLLTSLQEAARADDREALRKAAHTLKSASANIGALPLSDLCRELENKIRTNESVDAISMVAAIQAAYGKAHDALEEELARIG
jgi:CheY-like chemotaxis protein